MLELSQVYLLEALANQLPLKQGLRPIADTTTLADFLSR